MFEFGKICICIIIVLILISACLTFILIPKSPTITNNSELRCPSNEWNLINKSGFCFKLFEKSNMTFIQALSYCPEQQPNSYLAEITTDDEFDYINSTIKQDVWVLFIVLYI